MGGPLGPNSISNTVFHYSRLKPLPQSRPSDGGRTADDGKVITYKPAELAKSIAEDIFPKLVEHKGDVVVLVDSHVAVGGAKRTKPDARSHVVDWNFLSSFDTLLDGMRARIFGGEAQLSGRIDLSSPSRDFRLKVAARDVAAFVARHESIQRV